MKKPILTIAATGNAHKLGEFREILSSGDCSFSVVSAKDMGVLSLPEETGSTFAENARIKAEAVFQCVKDACRDRKFVVIADDSGLTVDALGGAPGIYSARYAFLSEAGVPVQTGDAADEANVAKLLENLRQVPSGQRGAAFVCAIAAITETGELLQAEGRFSGEITFAPAGRNGFGYDPVLFVPEYGCTVAELDPAVKNAMSHRGQALREAAGLLNRFYQEKVVG